MIMIGNPITLDQKNHWLWLLKVFYHIYFLINHSINNMISLIYDNESNSFSACSKSPKFAKDFFSILYCIYSIIFLN